MQARVFVYRDHIEVSRTKKPTSAFLVRAAKTVEISEETLLAFEEAQQAYYETARQHYEAGRKLRKLAETILQE
jgi:ribosomal protein S4